VTWLYVGVRLSASRYPRPASSHTGICAGGRPTPRGYTGASKTILVDREGVVLAAHLGPKDPYFTAQLTAALEER